MKNTTDKGFTHGIILVRGVPSDRIGEFLEDNRNLIERAIKTGRKVYTSGYEVIEYIPDEIDERND